MPVVNPHSATEVCTCHSDPTDRDSDRCGYRVLADRVIRLLNPPDDDVAETQVLASAVSLVAGYVASLPCTCPPAAVADGDEFEACARCRALGRLGNVRVPR